MGGAKGAGGVSTAISDKRGARGHFTPEEIEFIKQNYKRTNLRDIAKALGRENNYQNVCRAARRLGLTDQRGPKVEVRKVRVPKYTDPVERRIAVGKLVHERHERDGHPRGMLGKTHSPDFCNKQRMRLKEKWEDPNSYFNTEEFRDMRSSNASRVMIQRLRENPESIHNRANGGTREDLGFYVRSSWEANYARYLNWLKGKGEIHDWSYESDTYWFENIKRGCRSYTPDFKVWDTPDSYKYHEVKGYMDGKSQTKLKRMKKYYPNETVIVIGKEEYQAIKKWAGLIPGWETTK